ncbi:adenylate/guanylate cyclase domain-containing protein [Roseibium sp. HPY-6]|uniref:adenylate/guanylate cyclase domain-containing protein n=1 Tax=Roseibium sp. HPY-6 TaxID=3229852 RepID=UPI00338E45DD
MNIDAISMRMLSNIGVGVALADPESLTIGYRNPAFAAWFGVEDGAPLDQALGSVTRTELHEKLAVEEAIRLDVAVKRKRRLLTIETVIRHAESDGRKILLVECQNISRLRETEAMIDSYARIAEKKARELELEKNRVEKLLLNVMPRSVYEEYTAFGTVTPKLYEPVSVLMLDFVGFTQMAAAADPTVTVTELNDIFTAFDRIAEMHGCERIKTIGDAYLAVAGLPTPNPDHAGAVAQCASKMIRYLERRNESHPHKWQARIGIASGSVVGSVVGVQKYVYDVFGPAVNLASRLQSLSNPMEVTATSEFGEDGLEGLVPVDAGTVDIRGFGSTSIVKLQARGLVDLAA